MVGIIDQYKYLDIFKTMFFSRYQQIESTELNISKNNTSREILKQVLQDYFCCVFYRINKNL